MVLPRRLHARVLSTTSSLRSLPQSSRWCMCSAQRPFPLHRRPPRPRLLKFHRHIRVPAAFTSTSSAPRRSLLQGQAISASLASAAPPRYRHDRGCRTALSSVSMVLRVRGLQNYRRLLLRFCSRRGMLVALGRRWCTGAVHAVQQLCPVVPSRLGSSEGVADVSLMGIVPMSAQIPFGAPAVWRTATVPVNAAIPGVPSVRWHALLRRPYPAAVSTPVML
jgi:hypothetical protein